jgi:hypothetical protein
VKPLQSRVACAELLSIKSQSLVTTGQTTPQARGGGVRNGPGCKAKSRGRLPSSPNRLAHPFLHLLWLVSGALHIHTATCTQFRKPARSLTRLLFRFAAFSSLLHLCLAPLAFACKQCLAVSLQPTAAAQRLACMLAACSPGCCHCCASCQRRLGAPLLCQ